MGWFVIADGGCKRVKGCSYNMEEHSIAHTSKASGLAWRHRRGAILANVSTPVTLPSASALA